MFTFNSYLILRYWLRERIILWFFGGRGFGLLRVGELESSRAGELYGKFRPRQRARFIKQYLLYNDILLILQVAPTELNFLLCNVLLTGRHSVAFQSLLLAHRVWSTKCIYPINYKRII